MLGSRRRLVSLRHDGASWGTPSARCEGDVTPRTCRLLRGRTAGLL